MLEQTKLLLSVASAKAACWDKHCQSQKIVDEAQKTSAFSCSHSLTGGRCMDFHSHDESVLVSQVVEVVLLSFCFNQKSKRARICLD